MKRKNSPLLKQDNNIISPFLRWAGSKRQVLPILASYWKQTPSRYIEPFAGSAALFFYLHPKSAILADINSELIETYKEIRNNLPGVEATLRHLPKGSKHYYRWRNISLNSLSPTQRAARFIFLNRYCFNGLYRTNRDGYFNVPYGGIRTGPLPSMLHLQLCSRQLRKAKIISSSFEETLSLAKTGDFIYLDPPFHVEGKRVFREYSKRDFRIEDINMLRSQIRKLDRLNISFLVSYASSPEANLLSKGFHTKKILVRRNIAGFIGARKFSYEVLISNNPPK